MRTMKLWSTALALAGALSLPLVCNAETNSDAKAGTVKPDPLDKCVVSGEKLGEMGKPYVFTHEGREIKLCCKSCLKDFKKDPAKYVKKIEEAEAKAKK
jgi:YHS domain-containing protein